MSFNASNFLYSSSTFNGGSYNPSNTQTMGGGSRTSASKTWSFSSTGSGGYDHGNDYKESSLSGNGKQTMQNLNDRLASYLEKVRSLEEANADLETKIQEWHKKKATNSKKDYSQYEKAISNLQAQLIDGHLHGAKLTLQMENAQLASDDFKRKYDTEKATRTALEKDLEGLRKLMDDLTIVRTDLEMEVEGMRKQLIFMRKIHEEDMQIAEGRKKGSSVNVEVDAPPAADLGKIIAKMRKEYEAIIEKHRREVAERYNQQSTTVQQEVSTNTEALQANRNEIKELRRTLQTLEIELQAEISKKHALDNTLTETQTHSAEQLQKIQTLICQLEAELSKVRNDLERQNSEYKILLDIKSRLENEIATYRRLLDGNNPSGISSNPEDTSRKVRTIVQDVVNGRVVSSTFSEITQKP
ncbi:keratin, type I cytoskeletal 19-like [Spea bombifrons]|uniref:keratin, type I cytoskeletal 19-like n=1 Tax=Spea bombifrons TaxID=233779 RepID=UPI00234BF76F|nr:keratin, type I cytoskeletal 19-like [Spea bombifrons]